MRYSLFIASLIVLLIILLAGTGCKKDTFSDDPGLTLSFSTDTLTFDTVFTTVASVTLPLRVYNKNKNAVKISSIQLAGGANSQFRINVDGLPGDATDVELLGEDSLYVFVEVTLDPVSQNNPLLILDSINFLTNGNQQRVILAAAGQDAHFYNGEEICDETWTNDKPYVIFNSIAVGAGCKLTIQEGVRVHLSDNSGLFVYGTLEVNGGCDDDTVSFQQIRLEDFYDDIPGQWGGIFIMRGSTNNIIKNAEIKNSSNGLTVGSDTTCNLSLFTGANAPDIQLENVIIKNSFGTGFFAILSAVRAQNCLFFDSGDNLVSLIMGGAYEFTHCSFLNYGSTTTNHDKPILTMSNFAATGESQIAECSNLAIAADLEATFINTLIDGSLDEEIEFNHETTSGAAFTYLFDHCAVRTEYDIAAVPDSFVTCLLNVDPMFVDRSEPDYHLASGSPCIDAGKPGTPIMDDLDCDTRTGAPDIGCYEFM